ncbi:MAG: tripartite tricarboxylate transporter substrate binding protein [Hyphomicrobiaceae bacterium]|nr:tripartite tricarboxylate transporter substrate binding protein [Hyphomicrobiaceae bacterium]
MGGSLSSGRSLGTRASSRPAPAGAGTPVRMGSAPYQWVAALVAALLLCSCAAVAQQAGSTITIIVPYTAGTGPDTLARLLGEEIQVRWQQPVVVENKPGASGNIGTQVAARARADGSTLLLAASPFTQNVSLFKSVPYDPVADFAPIVHLTDAFMALAVHPAVPVTSAQGFVAHLKAHPGQLDYASPGRGTVHHLAMELFKLATGTDVKHVAYRGSAPAVQDLVGGHIGSMFLPVHIGLPLAKDNQIRLLAVANKERVSVAPDVPTLPEQGINGVDIDFWLGMLAPAATPVSTVERYNGVLNDILRTPRIADTLKAQGFVAVGGSVHDFAELIARDLAKWRKVVKDAGISPE